LRKPVVGRIITMGSGSSSTLMYSSAGFTKTLSWLLAAAIAAQPACGFSCGCARTGGGSGSQPAGRHSCCCCGSSGRCCCCCSANSGRTVSAPRRSCCRQRADRENAAPSVGTCKCGSGTPAQPSVPAGRSRTNDLTTPLFYAYAVTVDVPAVHQSSWAINRSTEFASASERCSALCRFLI
jgi:hypothetical protein